MKLPIWARWLALAAAVLLGAAPALASDPYRPTRDSTTQVVGTTDTVVLVDPGTGHPVRLGEFQNLLATVKTRIANTTTYTSATSTSPEAICLFTSVTICAPQTLQVSTTHLNTKGTITALMLTKSTTGATAATFRVYAFQGVPTLTSIFDASAYTPVLADISAGKFVGAWECATQVVNTDNSTYNCTSSTNDGHQAFQLTDGMLEFVLVATGAYAPGSGENFYIDANLATTAAR